MSSAANSPAPDHASTKQPAQSPSDQGASKAYQPSLVEPRITQRWHETQAFHPDPQRVLTGSAKPYCVLIPPPNVTGALHLGHALNNTLQDILVRSHRMMGYETLWMPGTDHAGIATQAVVEKRLLKEEGKRRKDFTREAFIERVQAWKDEYEARITGQLKAMGASCDFQRQRFTMDDICARAVREAFFILFRDGLIYRGKRLVNWDPVLQTAVADDECYEEEIDTNFWYMKYPLEKPVRMPDGTTLEHVTVATTRPETYLADTAVALNPRDPRAASLVGKFAILPLVGRRIPIVADDYVVLPESMAATDEEKNDPKAKYASGFLKVTPGHDQNDAELARRHNLPAINMMSPDGKVSSEHGWTDLGEAAMFVGLKMAEARKRVVEEFKARDLLAETRPYRQSVKKSERSQAIIEPYLSDQWYVKVTDDRMARAANEALVSEQRTGSAGSGGDMRFYPARYAKTFEHWHDNIRDWCISRQLWWGHRIPVWTKVYPSQAAVMGELGDKQYDFWEDLTNLDCRDKQPLEYALSSPMLPGQQLRGSAIDFAQEPYRDWPLEVRVCVRTPGRFSVPFSGDVDIEPWLEENGFVRDPDVLDTWFSSALWPLSTLGWPDSSQSPDTKGLLEAFNPTTVLSTAREIITLWVSRMTMMNRYLLGEGQGRGPVPFKDVFIHAVVQDGEGRKMSKSLGNGVDPLDIIESHGADAMRFTLCQMTTQTQDVRLPVVKDSKTGKNTSQKFDAGRNFVNKLWNTARFAMEKLPKSPPADASRPIGRDELSLIDRWILSRCAWTTKHVNELLAGYEFSDYAESMYRLLWWDVCDWYLEAIKPTIATSSVQQAVLAHVLETIVRLLHPITPFVTEAIFEQLKDIRTRPISGVALGPSRTGGLLCSAGWPAIDASWIDADVEQQFEQARELVNAVRNVRSEHQVPPKRRIILGLSASAAKVLSLAPGVVETLAGLEKVEIGGKPTGPSVALRAMGEEMHLWNLADAIDAGAERDRLSKQLEQLLKSEAALNGRLSNPGYVDRAPAKLVEESKAQLAKIRDEIAAIQKKL